MESDDTAFLERENEEAARALLGGVIFVSVLMVVGGIGNIHVLVVYTFCAKPSNRRTFILTLGVLDITMCIVGMPFIIYDLRHPLTFDAPVLCKIFRLNNYIIHSTSVLLLLVVAADRYRKVCRPLQKQISHSLARGLCFTCFVAAIAVSSPAPVLYGKEEIPTSNPNITGVRCGEENRFHNTPYMTFLNTGYICICLAAFIVLVVLYLSMWRVIKDHLALRKGRCIRTDMIVEGEENKVSYENNENNDDNTVSTITASSRSISIWTTGPANPFNETITAATHYRRNEERNKSKSVRTNIMFSYITLIFFFSYIPHFTLKIIAFAISDFISSLSYTSKVCYNIFVWSFFINNVANPLVYFFFDAQFRFTVKSFYGSLLFGKWYKYASDLDMSASRSSDIQHRRK